MPRQLAWIWAPVVLLMSHGIAIAQVPEHVRAVESVVADYDRRADMFNQDSLARVMITPLGPTAVPRLLGLFSDPTGFGNGPSNAVAALLTMPEHAAPAVPHLVTMLSDPMTMRRDKVAHLLGRIGPAAVPAMEAALRDGPRTAQAGVLAAVLSLPEPSVAAPLLPITLQMVRQPSTGWAARAAALEAIGVIGRGSSEAADVVAAAATNPDEPPHVSASARRALRLLVSDGYPLVGQLVARAVADLRSRDRTVRRSALDCLSELGPLGRAAGGDVAVALRDPSQEVRRAAAHALGEIQYDAPPSLAALIAVLGEEHAQDAAGEAGETFTGHVGDYAARALAKLGDAGLQALMAFLEQGSGTRTARRNALIALELMGPNVEGRARPVVTRVAATSSGEVRGRAEGLLRSWAHPKEH